MPSSERRQMGLGSNCLKIDGTRGSNLSDWVELGETGCLDELRDEPNLDPEPERPEKISHKEGSILLMRWSAS